MRDWACYCDEDGEPWAIFLAGHEHDLRTLRSVECRSEMKQAFKKFAGDVEDEWFEHDLAIGRYWIRDGSVEELYEASPNYPWVFCDKGDIGARPITGVKF